MLCHFCSVQLFAALWTVARQAPLSMGFSRQEYWSDNWESFSRILPDPGIEPMSLASPALAGGFFITSATREVQLPGRTGKPGMLQSVGLQSQIQLRD